MPSKLYQNQALAQVAYMNFLAIQATPKSVENLPVDPQGRIVIDVTLDDLHIEKLMRHINELTQCNFSLDKEGLEKALGRKVSATTTVSMDLSRDPKLKEHYENQLRTALYSVGAKEPGKIITQLNSHPHSSIIPLQQEFHFHLSLVARIYQKKIPELDSKSSEMATALRIAHRELNSHIREIYAKALYDSLTQDGRLNRSKLNKELDKARKTLMPIAHSILMQQIVKQTGVILNKDYFAKKPIPKDENNFKKINHALSLKTLAEQTTATPNDILHLDSEHGIATLIGGSENTAHHRLAGNEFAHRQLVTHALRSGVIKCNLNTRIQIRTPSPVVKEGLRTAVKEGEPKGTEYAIDVRKKLAAINVGYDLFNRLEPHGKKPRAFIYNSYTAINDTLGDTGGNLQTESAHHILRGAHYYNNLQRTEEKPVFCFVQNISVNGFGNTLGYGTNDPLVLESTLMAELALLHTLYDTVPHTQTSLIDKIFEEYKNYLPQYGKTLIYFAQTEAGARAIKQIQALKKDWQSINDAVPSRDLAQQAKLALRNLMAFNLHYTHEYAKLFQTLSVFVEEASIGGCKSGNERAQCINGRVAILDSLINNSDLDNKKEIRTTLAVLAQGGNKAPKAAQALKAALDKEYNRSGLHGAASIVSLVDQGASAKVESKPGHPFYISRNYAEEPASVISNLHQTKAGSMQAHKNLTSYMQNVWEGNPKSWWARMQSTPLGIFGAIAGVITIIPAVIVALYSALDNSQRRADTLHANEIIKKTVGIPSDSEQYNSSHSKMASMFSEAPSNPVYPVAELVNSMQSTQPAAARTAAEQSPLPNLDTNSFRP